MYRFDATGWHPHADLPQPGACAAHRNKEAPAEAAPPIARRPVADDAPAGQDLGQAARGQRMLVHCILASFVLNAIARSVNVHRWGVFALFAGLTVYSLVAVARLCAGLGKSRAATVLCVVLSFVPLVGLVTWIVLSVQATRALRAAGWQVGFFGAKA
jgi:hypothetical protein